ncbi:MAG: hypothetical protein A2046_16955 [Bacteroidetes bacterium GWA2_30_7]|nr:MAG: hypothetical protein A2046_16955 [Bacteroidetes bacterium GWA2_30_7]
MNKFDVLIIGSGLGGLITGVILSKEGYNVCVIEKQQHIGGCIQNFTRDNCIFDVGGHYIGGFEKGQNLYTFFNYLGIADKLNLRKLDVDCFDKIIFQNGENYSFAMGFENHKEKLLEKFPKENKAISDYLNKIRETCDKFPLYNLKKTDNPLMESIMHNDSFDNLLNGLTNNQKLKNVLSATNSLYAGIKEKSPFYMHALIMNSYIESSWRFVDGSSQLAVLLKKQIELNGGKVLTNHEALSFTFSDNCISSVNLKNKEPLFAQNFISNIHPTLTLKMIPDDKIRKAYRHRINSLENTIGMFTVYGVLEENSFTYINHNDYIFRDSNVWTAETYSSINYPEHCLMITPASSKSDKYADCVILMAYMNISDLSKWINTDIEKRGTDYKDFKDAKAQGLINFANKYYPDLKSKIKKYYTSTPLTYRDYTGTIDGSLYGISKDYKNLVKSVIFPKTHIPNLLMTGQNINLHGVLGVTIGSILTCSELIGIHPLINKIVSSN